VGAVLLTRLYLRNFRVYEDELDLELPPGLVGIYGPNGAGKSTLLEAILWTLWGKARTTKEQIRSAGVGGDCITEVEFEHEGHLYLVRRTLSGLNATPRLEARCDGLVMSQGVRDAERYVESILGMDDSAFRASVFAEQKQLAAFSSHSPADRLRLVLRLLGITPLDAARDTARKDARQTLGDHARLRDTLPDVDALRIEAADAEARAEAASARAATEQQAAVLAEDRARAAAGTLEGLDRRRQDHDALVIEGRGVRAEFEAANQMVTQQQTELEELDAAAKRLAAVERAAAGVDAAERELELLSAAATATANTEKIQVLPEPPAVDETGLEAARSAAAAMSQRLAGLESLRAAAEAEVDRAREVSARSLALSDEADCPLCGQALGDAFEQVQAHRAADVAAAQQRLDELSPQLVQAGEAAKAAATRQTSLVAEAEKARTRRQEWELADQRYRDATEARQEAWEAVLHVARRRAGGHGSDGAPSAAALAEEVARLRAQVQRQRAAAAEAQRLHARLERRPALEASLLAHQERAALAGGRLQTLREKVRALGFDADALRLAVAAHEEAAHRSQAARDRSHEAAIDAARQRAVQEAAAIRLTDGIDQHARLAGLESDARHLARVADLLAEFRNTVVAAVGPRLAVQAAELFAELTDHEYDELQVDPENYQLQITDGGKVYGLDRFSGSEIDLANLALRVAISEHVHLQSGGSIGLLVLDEVFGPLDEERKTRMLLALERLRGRFRQILVVTHDPSIKEQLPNAIEVTKLPGRRAAARLLSA
jgi:exonuclease SbcC